MKRASFAAVVALLLWPTVSTSTPSQRPRASSPSQASPAKSPPKRAPARPKAKPRKATEPPPAPPPAPPSNIPDLIEIARVHVEVAPDRVLVTSDFALGRGEWQDEALRVHVAYGAPGLPLAFEAHLCASLLKDGAPPSCSPLPHALAYRAPSDAAFVIGPARMAGQAVELAPEALVSAFGEGDVATLRIRQLRPLPIAGDAENRELLIRLGESRGSPYPLGKIEVGTIDGATISEVDARLCGVDVEAKELSVTSATPSTAGIPPKLVRREGHEDLCVRFKLD